MARDGADFTEIAGNDGILFSATSLSPQLDGALYCFASQGYGDTRHLVLVKVTDLAETLRGLAGQSVRLDHMHDC